MPIRRRKFALGVPSISQEADRLAVVIVWMARLKHDEVVISGSSPSLGSFVHGGSMDYEDRLEQCDRILEMCAEIGDDGREFADSVTEKVESMADWIEQNQRSTEKMDDALDNMEAACQKWLK